VPVTCLMRGSGRLHQIQPLVRRDAVARYGPRLLAVLDTVSARLTTGSLRALNARVDLRGQDPRLVAESWLRAQGLASAGGASH
jgi:osmoprotectant transport system substrate-binding protein